MDLVPIPNLKMSIKWKVCVTMEIFHQGLRATSIETLVLQVFWIGCPAKGYCLPCTSRAFTIFE